MDRITMECLVVKTGKTDKTGKERVRLLLGDLAFDFDAADIVAFEPLPPPPGLAPGRAVLARIALRAGAGLHGVVPASAYQTALWRWRQPFVFAARTAPFKSENEGFEAQELAFLRQRGIAFDAHPQGQP